MTRVRNWPGVFLVTTRSKISCTRSGRPRSRLSRMISSKNSRAAKGPVEDLRQADLHLPDGQIPFVTRPPVLWTQRQRNPAQPFAEEAVNILRLHGVADHLQFPRLRAGQETVVQRLIADAPLLQLPFRPFVPVQTQLDAPWRVAANLHK